MATVKKSKKGLIIAICVILAVAIIAGTVFSVMRANAGESVSLYTIATDDIYENVSLTGEVTSGTSKEYKVSGVATVKEVFVKEGDEVKKGDLLATFNVDSLDSQIASLQATYNDTLKSYNSAVSEQKTAAANVDMLEDEIRAVENRIAKLEAQEETTAAKTTKKPNTQKPSNPTTKPSTSPSTTKAPSAPSSTPSSSSDATTRPTINPGESVSELANQLKELNEALEKANNDLDELTASMNAISTVISQNIGKLDNEVIAQLVIDELVNSGVAEDVAKEIVSSIDFEAIAASVTNSKNAKLTTAEIQLVSLQAQKAIFEAKADGTVTDVQKQALKASKSALDTLKQQKAEMESGWKAAFDGTVTEVDLTPGMQTTVVSTGIKLENLNTMAVTVSLGEYDLHKVKVGMQAEIKTAYGKYKGEVTSIAPTATGGSSSGLLDSVGSMAGISGLSSLTDSGAGVECVITIPETDEFITAGFDADVKIETGEYLGVTVVPIESIKLEKTGSYVYLYNEEEGTVTKTLIETGAVSDSAYEVKSGIKAGDKIVAAPASTYEEDTFKVKVVQQ